MPLPKPILEEAKNLYTSTALFEYNKYYTTRHSCSNCNNSSVYVIEKGSRISEFCYKCPKCGCVDEGRELFR